MATLKAPLRSRLRQPLRSTSKNHEFRLTDKQLTRIIVFLVQSFRRQMYIPVLLQLVTKVCQLNMSNSRPGQK
jgi:hypothetical protein